MVLERLLPLAWTKKRSVYAFFIGAAYSIIGILLAKFLFPSDPALVAVAFIAILILPQLYKVFSVETRREEKRLSLGKLVTGNAGLIKSYLFLFLGILLIFSLASIVLPSFETNMLFREQLEMRQESSSVAGHAFFDMPFFLSILINNVSVLIVVFLISFVTGDGAIFLITWNASVWGTIFGMTAKNAAVILGVSPVTYFLLIMIVVLPHVVIEATAYILGAISGGIISKDVVMVKVSSKQFNRVFFTNLWLFIIALVVLAFGAIVETYVISNVPIYYSIIQHSLMVG